MTAPVFAFGFQRSGTTLFSAMLDRHPDLAVPFSVTGLWLETAHRLGDYNHLRTGDDVKGLVGDLCREPRLLQWNVAFDPAQISAGLPAGDYPAVIARFHEIYAAHHGKSRWGHMDIATLAGAGQVLDWFPDARFVHLVRDARAVALSNQGIPFSLGNYLECAERWAQDVSASLAWGRTLPEGRYHVVRYEDLLAAPEATLKTLCTFLELPYAGEMLDFGDSVAARIPPDRLQSLWPLLEGPLQPAQADRWQTDMPVGAQALVERVAGGTLSALGYDIPAEPRAKIRASLTRLWCEAGRGGRFSRRIAKLTRGRG